MAKLGLPLNLLILGGWVLWGWGLAQLFPSADLSPEFTEMQVVAQAVFALLMPSVVLWFYSRLKADTPWPKPSVSQNIFAVLRAKDPTWVFHMALWFSVGGGSWVLFAVARGSSVSTFQVAFPLTGVSLFAGWLIAAHICRSRFAA